MSGPLSKRFGQSFIVDFRPVGKSKESEWEWRVGSRE